MRTLSLIALAVLVATPLDAQEVQRVRGSEVAIYNIAGEVQVVRGSGSDVVVRIERGGSDAARLSIETGEIRGRQTLRVVYPDDQIVYPELGRGSQSSTTVRRDGTFSDGGRGGERVEVRGSGRGLEAWADLVIEVPSGQAAAVYLMVGSVEARGVDGRLDIDTGSGGVVATDMTGRLSVDTGSGSVRVAGMDGDLIVDTGSGRVEVSDVVASEIDLDTGSGRVIGRNLQARRLIADTGSGSIELAGVSAPDIMIDTGSGAVELELLSDVDRLEIDTGSGGVTVYAPESLGAEIEIDTGSGGIDFDFPVEMRSARRDHVTGRIGDGRGEIVIDTGSGGVRFRRR